MRGGYCIDLFDLGNPATWFLQDIGFQPQKLREFLIFDNIGPYQPNNSANHTEFIDKFQPILYYADLIDD